jgi:malyl-CoA/(S)-citramalyl-CoA lyase
MLRSPRDFFKPKVVGAPEPLREIPVLPSRMIHFFDPSNEKMAVKVPDIAKNVDIMLGNLEDAVPIDRKEAAREGLVTDRQERQFRRYPVLDARQQPRQSRGSSTI